MKGKNRVCLVLFSLLFILTSYQFIFAQAFKRFKDGDKVIPFVLKTLDGKEINISSFEKNNFVGIVFWKLGSERSIASLKYMQKMLDLYSKDFGFVLVAIYCPREPAGISSSELEEVKKVISENKINIPVLLDEGLKIFSNYGVISLPSTTFLDKDGIAKYILAGFPKFGAEQNINKNIKNLLGIPEEIAAKKKYEPKLDADRNYKLALAVLERGNTDKAMDYLKNAVTIDPQYPAPYTLLGKLYFQLQQKEQALENYRKSLELDPDNIELMIKYGFLCMDLSMPDDALLIFKTIIEKSPEYSSSAHYGIGNIYLNNKVFDSARLESERADELYRKTKKYEPFEKFYFAQNLNNLAEIYINFQEKSKAIESLKSASEKYQEILNELVRETRWKVE